MVRPLLDAGAPIWAQQAFQRLEQLFVSRSPRSPVRLWSVTQAELPAAADYPGCIVFVSDLNKLGLSNGTTWTDATGGAL